MNTGRLTNLSKILLLTVALIFGATVVSGNAVASATKVTVNYSYITVSAGQTLWTLAERYGKDQDPRDWIAKLVDLNNLGGSSLQPGQRLALPN